MELDNIREILYSYTKELAIYIEEHGMDISDEDEVEAVVEEFITDNEDLIDVSEDAEESY